MATDYASLQTEIIDWCAKSGDTAFAAMVPTFIAQCENRFNRELRIRYMEDVANTVITDVDGWVALPADFREIRAVLAMSTPVNPLQYVTPNKFNQLLSSNPLIGGTPAYFTVIGTEMRVYPVALNMSLEIIYFASIPSLSNTVTTNEILLNIPDLYTFGTLRYAAMYNGDTFDDPQHGIVSSATKWEQEYQQIISSIKSADQRAEYPGLTAIQSDIVY